MLLHTHCEHCKMRIKSAHITTLELSSTDGQYYKGDIPAGHVSQGAFDFHPRCALKELKKQPAFAARLEYCNKQQSLYTGLAITLETDLDAVNRPLYVPFGRTEDLNILSRAVVILRRRAQEYGDKRLSILADLAK